VRSLPPLNASATEEELRIGRPFLGLPPDCEDAADDQ
jgi:hypothetical protein